MKERPILFSGPMALAILDGRKTMTRRVIKPPFEIHPNGYLTRPRGNERLCPYSCPYGQPGDRLWVRETWRVGAWDVEDGGIAVDYKASPEITRTPWLSIPDDDDGEKFNRYWLETCNELARKGIKPDDEGEHHWEPGKAPLNWRPSIYMPHWASRILLEIISVRVERVQDISEVDQINAKRDFKESDPLVWVVEFKRIEP